MFSTLTAQELFYIYKDYTYSKLIGIRCESLVPYTREYAKNINTHMPVTQFTEYIEKQFLEEIAKRYFCMK